MPSTPRIDSVVGRYARPSSGRFEGRRFERKSQRAPWLLSGLLCGISAAVVGIPPVIHFVGLRPWHMLALCALFIALTGAQVPVQKLKIHLIDILMVLFAFVSVVLELFNSSELEYAFDLGTVISPLYYLIGYYVARVVVTSREVASDFLLMFSVASVPVAIASVLQVGSPQVSRLILAIAPGPGLEARILDGRLIRATGFVGHWTGLGFYFCACLAAACMAAILSSPFPRVKNSLKLIIVASFLGALSTLTLSVLATATLIVLSFLLVRGIRPGALVAAGAVAVVSYYRFGALFQERIDQQTAARLEYLPSWVPNTLSYRWRIWSEQTIPTISERVWTGWGSNLYSGRERPRRLIWHSAESQWFGQAVAYGVVGTLLLLAVCIGIAYHFARRVRSEQFRYQMPGAMLILGCLAASFTVPVFTNRGLPVALWVLLGVVVSIQVLSRVEDRNVRVGSV